MFALRAMGAFALVLLVMPASADDCTEWTTTTPIVYCTQWAWFWPPSQTGVCAPGTFGGLYYIQQDNCGDGCIFSIWIYQESNGIAGLQRGDEVVDETCHGMIEPDTVIF